MWDAVDLPPARRKPLPRLGVRYPRGDPSVGYRDDGEVGGRLKSLYVLIRLPLMMTSGPQPALGSQLDPGQK